MAPSNKILIDVSHKEAATEETCSKDCDYIYLLTSKMTDDIKHEVETCVKEDLIAKPLIKCKCRPKNGECCASTQGCPNRKNSYACLECSSSCKNNPWKNKTFAIQRNKLCTHFQSEKGWGLYAKEVIKKFEFLGEYKGVLTKEIPTDKRLEYLMVLKHGLEVYIDPFLEGSAMRLCNNGCYPSAKAVTYIHNGEYKCVFIATRNIIPGEEITINYGWTYNRRIQQRPECRCGHVACLEVLGDFHDNEDQRIMLPSEFPNISIRASAAKVEQLNKRPELNPLDLHRVEDHIFGVEEPVAVIILLRKQLRISRGKVIECYKTKHKLFFYVVRVVEHGVIDYHVPMWLVFRNIEVAEVMLRKVYTSDEKETITKYFTNVGSRRSPRNEKKRAEGYEGEILYSYVKRLLDGDIPKFVKKDCIIGGVTSLGFGPTYLDLSEDVIGISNSLRHGPIKPTSKYPLTGQEVLFLEEKICALRKTSTLDLVNPSVVSSTNASGPVGSRNELLEDVSGSCFPVRLDGTQPSVAIEAANGIKGYSYEIVDNLLKELGIRNGEEPQDDSDYEPETIAQPNDTYSASNTASDINQTIEKFKNIALFKRFYQHAVEQLTIITLWRSPSNVTLNFEEVYQNLEKELYAHYYAPRPRDRRFLLLEHYKVNCEIVKPGSYNLRYCSLCGMSHNYETLQYWNNHFREHHEIGAALYRCKCPGKYETKFISEFHRHVEKCCPELEPMLTTSLPDFYLDSFTYYMTLRGVGNKMRHLLVPGQASVVEPNENKIKKQGVKGSETEERRIGPKKEKVLPLVDFRPDTLMPIDKKIVMKPHTFKIQQTATELPDKWEWHSPKHPQSVFELSKLESMSRKLPACLVNYDTFSSDELPKRDSKVVDRKRRSSRTKITKGSITMDERRLAGPILGAALPDNLKSDGENAYRNKDRFIKSPKKNKRKAGLTHLAERLSPASTTKPMISCDVKNSSSNFQKVIRKETIPQPKVNVSSFNSTQKTQSVTISNSSKPSLVIKRRPLNRNRITTHQRKRLKATNLDDENG